ncbi:hypothetical protein SNE40_000458 [Patella caerulea]|uniref:Uncharacterized protein n=1 Tax=Patella caerulea TaxID=87958 RepID=A0AAN8KLB3_PATCE
MLVVLLITCCSILVVTTESASKHDYYDLYNDTFSLYNKNVRPVNNATDVLKIHIYFSLVYIHELLEKEQILVSFGYIDLRWQDDSLSWDASAYGHIESLVVPQSDVWRPDLVVGNSIEIRQKLGFDDLPIRVYADGYIAWRPTVLFRTSCHINVQFYPFDQQVCIIVLETMVSSALEIDPIVDNADESMLTEYLPHGQWDLINAEIEKFEEPFSFKTSINIRLTLQRRLTFYVLNIIVPIFCLSLLGVMVFALPANTGEKISLAVAIVLAYMLFMSIIKDSIPQTSLPVAVLQVYLSLFILLSALSVILSIIILRLYHKNPNDPIPRKIKRLVLWQCCARCRKPNQIMAQTTTIAEDMGNQNQMNNVTWQDVSKSLDIGCFWLYVIVTLAASGICLYNMIIQ